MSKKAGHPSFLDYTLLAICLLLFVVPMTLTGLNKTAPGFWPKCLHNYYRVSCLFTERTNRWTSYYVQGQRGDDLEWKPLDTSAYFRLKPFGYRTRLNPIISYSFGRGSLGIAQRQQLAEYLRDSIKRDNPALPEFTAIRFVYLSFNSGGWLAEADSNWGKWMMKPMSELEQYSDGSAVASTHTFDGNPATLGGHF